MKITIDVIFPNPTVKEVVFQISFPNLFYIENKIGDIQLKIIKEFPESKLLFRRQIVFADLGPNTKLDAIPHEAHSETGKKIWQFKSKKNVRLNILSNSLDLTSQYHKTYNIGDKDKFRDIIKFVVDSFMDVMPIPTITRIGLRYVDECPFPSKDNLTFDKYFNSIFPTNRFNLKDVEAMDFRTVIKKGDYFLTYMEALQVVNDECKLILDFDGSARDVDPENYLQVTDDLHTLMNEEYEKTIKEPVYDYMQKTKEE